MDKLLEELKGLTDNDEIKDSIPPWALLMLKIVNAACAQLTQTCVELKKDNESLKMLIDAQEQYSRRNCLLIHGVAETPRENTDNLVLDIIHNQLGISEQIINKKSLDRSHRLGKIKNPDDRSRRNTGRPIIVKFALYNERNNVFFNKKKLKNSNVMITENLTKIRHDILKKSLGILGKKSCWTIDGKILTKINDEKIEIRGWTPDNKIITLRNGRAAIININE